MKLALTAIIFALLGACTPKTESKNITEQKVPPNQSSAKQQAAAPQRQTTPPPTDVFRPVGSLNLTAYPFDRREDLREVLQTRMQSLDQGIDELRGKINSMPANGGEIMQQRMTDVSMRFDSASERLEGLEEVPPEGWNTYKRVLRDEIASLEAVFAQLQVAVR